MKKRCFISKTSKGFSVMKIIMNNVKNSRLPLCIALFLCFSLLGKLSPQQIKKRQVLAKSQQINKNILEKKRGLIIILDDSETGKYGVAHAHLLSALYQEASPIIVSVSLLYSLASHYDNPDVNYESPRMWSPNRWIIKRVNDSLNLLIPMKYLETLNVESGKVEEYKATLKEQLTDVELRLGFKVNHMQTMYYSLIKKSMFQRFLGYFSKAPGLVRYFVSSLDDIFVQKIDYIEKNADVPEWYVYIYGHGRIKSSMSFLSLKNFQQFLGFLNNKIIVKLLVVSSCFVAGTNSKIFYGKVKSDIKEEYSFPIIVQGLNDVMTTGLVSPTVNERSWYYDKNINVLPIVNFSSFFEKAKSLEGNYSEIVKPISEEVKASAVNMPQIKLPGSDWFSVIEGDKKIISIGSNVAQIKNVQESLDVVAAFKKDPELILLYTDTIPFELKINSTNLKEIISMVTSKSKGIQYPVSVLYTLKDISSRGLKSTTSTETQLYNWIRRKAKNVAAKILPSRSKQNDNVRVIQRIKKISSNRPVSEMIHWFSPVIYSGGTKWFFIGEMGSNKDILILGTYNEGMRVYFKDKDGVLWTEQYDDRVIEFMRVERGSIHEKFYDERMRIIRKLEQKDSSQSQTATASEEIKKETIVNK
jgi:hypothetical protein